MSLEVRRLARTARSRAGALTAQSQFRERLREVGLDVGQSRSSEELASSLRAGYERVGALLQSIDFKPQ
jgi:hypothetical protein